jgi:hypothetical protein
MTPSAPLSGRLSPTVLAAALVGAVGLLPFARGLLSGSSFYFRDLSLYFLPQRRFVLGGLRAFELRFWNPFTHEGTPVFPPPLAYPLDLLQLLRPDEGGISLVLALHVPLAAIAFLLLARELGLPLRAGIVGALAYALGGFLLSCLNLYVFLEAAAWAPAVVLVLHRLRDGGRRDVALASLVVAVALSTTGVEIVAQAFLVGLVLAARASRGFWGRAAAAAILGLGTAGATILGVAGQTAAESARSAGFSTAVTLSHSIHPLTLLQILIGDFHGDLQRLTERWWGMNFFTRGFPYFLSLYLGPLAVAVAGVGVVTARAPRRLLALALGALVVALGSWVGLQPIVEAIPLLHQFRYPAKAFFTVHLAAALLVAYGIAALAAGSGWRSLLVLAGALGASLAMLPLVPRLFPHWTRWFAAGFFPPDHPWPLRLEQLATVAADARTGGLLALVAALLALGVLARRLHPGFAATTIVGLVAADLLRCGAALNPMVPPAFFRPSPPTSALLDEIRGEGGRVFSLDPEASPAYAEARAARGESHELWTFATLLELQVPEFNLEQGIPTAFSLDRTMLTASTRILPPADASPDAVGRVLPRLRRAGVAHVLSLDPLSHPDLEPRAEIAPARIAPLSLHAFRVRDPLPLRVVAQDVRVVPPGAAAESDPVALAAGTAVVEGAISPTEGASGLVVETLETVDRLDLRVTADRPTVVVVRDAFAPGWTATVNGRPAPVLRADGRHRAVPVPAGESRVRLSYRPPRMLAGVVVTLAALLVIAVLAFGRRPTSLSRPPALRREEPEAAESAE